jgi:hypothetical protein
VVGRKRVKCAFSAFFPQTFERELYSSVVSRHAQHDPLICKRALRPYSMDLGLVAIVLEVAAGFEIQVNIRGVYQWNQHHARDSREGGQIRLLYNAPKSKTKVLSASLPYTTGVERYDRYAEGGRVEEGS